MKDQTLGHYRIVEKIGVGGMGEVYRARDERLDREVAIKVLPQQAPADDSKRRRLRKEAEALSKLNHPNIEMLLEFDTVGDVEFLVVEYVVGENLSDMITRGSLAEKEIARLGVQLAEGLAAAHAKKVVHRDLKPGNLRVTSDGRLKILDFGIAKFLKPQPEKPAGDATTDSTSGEQGAIGTLPYMAPEQLDLQVADARTDIYAAGAVLYEMATGQRPFREENAPRLIDAILHQPLVPPRALRPRVSLELERIITKCLQKGPENRYQSAQELAVDLRQLATPITTDRQPALRGAPRSWRKVGLTTVSIATVAAVLLGLNVGGLRDVLLQRSAVTQIRSLAVLPFDNLSGDPNQDYFADGMTDEIITDLAKIKALRVCSRTSVMQYKGTRKPMPQIARELRVDAVIEGSVMRDADRVRIIAQLIDGATDKHLWAESYARDLRDVLKLQGDVANDIVSEIRIAVTPQERQNLRCASPVVPAAYEAYLQGRYHLRKDTEEERQIGKERFALAVKIDPNYAPAYAGLADYYWSTDELPAGLAMSEAKQYALKALEIDSTLTEAYTSLGAVRFYAEWDWPEAERDFKRALELDPGNVEAYRMYSDYSSAMGRAEEAVAQIHRAQELDPQSIPIQITLGWAFYYAHRYDQAVEVCGRILLSDRNSVGAHDCLGLSYLAEQQYERAIEECQMAVKLSGNDLDKAVGLARAYALAGNKAAARKVLNELEERARRSYVPSTFFAQVRVALGEKQQALAWLRRAYTERDPYLARLKVEPAFDAIRSDPGFQGLMDRLGLRP